MKKLIFGALTLLLCAGSAAAISTKIFRITSYKDFEEGETEGVLLSSLGEATAGYGSTRLDLPAAQVFCAARAPDGTVWLGTGDQAEVYAFDGKALKKRVQLEGVLASALAAAPDGTVYAASLPGARIWQIKGNERKEIAKLEGADQIWALAIDPAKNALYAATGPNGRLYSVELSSGKNKVIWDSGEKHLLSLLREKDGSFLVGSGEEAILYRVSIDGTARALQDFGGDEVRALASDGKSIYVAVNEFEKGQKGGAPGATPARTHGIRIVLPPPPATPPSPPPPGRDRKGKGAVFRVDSDGRVEQLHALGDGYFTALALDPRGDLYAASGANGRIYLIRPDRTLLTAFNFPERQVLSLALDGPHPVIGTGDSGAVYSIDFAPARTPRYFSKVLDAVWPAHWGAVAWSASGDVTVETRSGNTSRPDKTWSAWEAPRKLGSGSGRITSPDSRYLQLRASPGREARLRDLTVYYLPQNQRARVTEVTVGDDPGSNTAKAARAAGKPRSPVVKVRWKVENPDDDELVFRLHYRQETEPNWKPIGGTEPITARELEWNTEGIPDGNYVLKVEASDERANPADQTLKSDLVSAPFLVDNRKPEVVDLKIAGSELRGEARDSFSPITELSYSIDGGDWHPFAPRDRVFDEPREPFVVRLPEDLQPGAHSVTVRAVDAAENVGLGELGFHTDRAK